jgi:GAF domain-containing protein
MFENRRRLHALYEVLRTADAAMGPEALEQAVIGPIAAALQADRATLYRLDARDGRLHSTVLTGDATLEIRLDVGQGLAGWVAMTSRPLRINDVLKDDRFDGRWDARSGYRTRTVLAVPLLRRGRLDGVLQVLNSARGRFDDEDQALLEAIALAVGLGIDAVARR